MVARGEMGEAMAGARRRARWRGRSGRLYALLCESLDSFAMAERALYLIAKGNLVLWVGSSAELVADPMSRSRFRLALDCADRVYRLEGQVDDVARMTTIWDIESAEPEAGAEFEAA